MLNFYFDKIYVINLKKDKLRKEIFIQNNSFTNLNFDFFKAINGKENKYSLKLFKKYKNKNLKYPGEIGYLLTMRHIFNDAISNNYEKILVFDDDVILHKNFNKILIENLDEIKDWHILRLGALIKNKFAFYEKTHKSIMCDGSFAIGYDKRTFDFFINEKDYFKIPFDTGVLNRYNHKNYTIKPFLSIADVYKSNIRKSKNLYNIAKKFNWNLNNFNIVNSERKVLVVIYLNNKTNIGIINFYLNQTYKNIKIILLINCNYDQISIDIVNKCKNNNILILKKIKIIDKINFTYLYYHNYKLILDKMDKYYIQNKINFIIKNNIQNYIIN